MDVKAGRVAPLPDYAGEWFLAKWMGVTRADLDRMPIHEVEEARIVRDAEIAAQNDAHERANRKRK